MRNFNFSVFSYEVNNFLSVSVNIFDWFIGIQAQQPSPCQAQQKLSFKPKNLSRYKLKPKLKHSENKKLR